MFVVISLVLLLININRFGKTIAVPDEKGIHSGEGFIQWKDIRAVRYDTSIPGKQMSILEMCCSITIFTDKKEYKIVHAPRKMLWYIKKKKPTVKVKCDYGLIILLVCPFIFGVFIGLLD